MAQKAKITQRTVCDIEKFSKVRFNESTILSVCEVLGLDANQFVCKAKVVVQPSEPKLVKNKTKRYFIVTGLLFILIAIFLAFLNLHPSNGDRVDWIYHPQLQFDVATPESEFWSKHWVEGATGEIMNFINTKQTLMAGETAIMEIKWSYRYGEGTPVVFANCFMEWDPDDEIQIYSGILTGDGSIEESISFTAPKRKGIYRIRVFIVKAFAPIPSFYGSPPDNQVYAPSSTNYSEIIIEVL